MKKNLFTYKKSGVNINAADKFVNFIANISSNKRGNKKLNNIGGFGSISDLPKNIKRPKIVACTDGVGTKVEIANIIKKYDTIGIDLVAMSVNDLIVQGAKPIFFLDYISINKIDLKKLKALIKGINIGCNQSECKPLEGIATIRLFFLILFLFKILFFPTTPTAKPAISNLPFSYVPGISAVSPPTSSHSD